MHPREEKKQVADNSFVSKTIEEKLDEAIEAMNKGEVRSFDSFMNELKKKYSNYE